jgi:hypothetical protein
MPKIIDLSDTSKAAFSRGLWKGMAAPLMLFSTFDAAAEVIKITAQELPKRSSPPGSDWIKVGDALRAAAEKERQSGGR